MITYDYLPRVNLFRVEIYITLHVSSLYDYRGMNMNEKKYVVISDLIFAIFIF